MCGSLTSSWHQSDITDVIWSSSLPPSTVHPMTQIIPDFLPNIKSQHLERVFTFVGWSGQLCCEGGGEERRGEGVDILLHQWHLSDTCAHILTNEWQSDQNIWAIKTENNIHRPPGWSHWLPSLTQLGWTRNIMHSVFLTSHGLSSKLSSKRAEMPFRCEYW